MARLSNASPLPRRALAGACALLALLTLLPARWTAWVGPIGRVGELLVAPVHATVSGLTRWLRRADAPDEDVRVTELRRQLDELTLLYLQSLDDRRRLENQIVALQRGTEVDTDSPVRAVAARVIGVQGSGRRGSPAMLTIRAGTSRGVRAGDVVAGEGVHLVGRVAEAGARTSAVLPLTAPESRPIRAAIMLEPVPGSAPVDRLACQLAPGPGQTLTGKVEDLTGRTTEPVPDVAPGMLVRLSDPSWPPQAQMLVVGVVERVEREPNQRRVVTVRPGVDWTLLADVIVRTAPEGAGGAR